MESFYRGKKVFVTGHTGFKGAWLCLILKRLGAEVCGYALEPPTRPNLYELVRAGDGMASIRGDIRDPGCLAAAMGDFRPDIVLHLAAQAIVRRSYQDPLETFGTNVMGTAALLEALRRTRSVRAAVVVTSDKCYENREWLWGYREDDPLGGSDPYSSSKGCAEMVTSSYRRSFFPPGAHGTHGLALASARAGNVIGGGDFAADRLVPDMVRSFTAGEPVHIRHPRATRPWQHVLDPLAGYLLLAQRLYADGPAFAEAWNFGPCAAGVREVGWVVERFASLWGAGASWRRDEGTHPPEAGRLTLESAKARSRLGWRPRLDVEEALRWTADWYRAFRDDPASLGGRTEAQIRAYDALAGGEGVAG